MSRLLPAGFRFGAGDRATAEAVAADEWRSEDGEDGEAGVRVLARHGDPHEWLALPAPLRFAAGITDGAGAWVVLPELNGQAIDAFVRTRLELGFLVRALDNMLTAAVLAARALKARGATRVELGLRASDEYETEWLLADLVCLRARGIERAHLHDHLAERRSAWYAAAPPAGVRTGLRRRLSASVIPLEKAFPRAIAAVLDSPAGVFDAVELTWRRSPPDPAALSRALVARRDGLPVVVADPGPSTWNTARQVRTHLAAVVDALRQGAPVAGYRWLAADDEAGTYGRLVAALRAGDERALAA